MIYTHEVQMRFSDLDVMGHVNHARFLTYIEDARVALLRQLAESAEQSDASMILAHIDLDYLHPLTLGSESVAVDIWIDQVGSKSFTVKQEVRQGEEVAARGSTIMVAFDYSTQSTRMLSDNELEVLEHWKR